MDELIIRSLRGQATSVEERQLAEWRAASVQNEDHYRQLLALWNMRDSFEAEFATSVPRATELLKLANVRVFPTAEEPPLSGFSRRFQKQGRYRLRTLGLVAAAVACIALIARTWPVRRGDVQALGVTELITDARESSVVRLTDGTVVRLAPSSRLRFGGAAPSREVWLDGRAFFAVAKSNGRRFLVRTHAGDVTVLGTRFDVQTNGKDLQLVVVEGRVAVSARGKTVSVGPRELLRLAEQGQPSVAAVQNVDRLLEWMGGFLVFKDTPLREAVEEIGRRYGIRTNLLDSTIALRAVTGWFSDQTPEQMLAAICRAADVRCVFGGGVVTVGP